MDSVTYSFENLATGYVGKGKRKILSYGLSAELMLGDLTCLLGVNGSGKSTLLRTLAGFQPPLKGMVTLMGKRLEDYSREALAKTVSVVLTEKLPTDNLTVG